MFNETQSTNPLRTLVLCQEHNSQWEGNLGSKAKRSPGGYRDPGAGGGAARTWLVPAGRRWSPVVLREIVCHGQGRMGCTIYCGDLEGTATSEAQCELATKPLHGDSCEDQNCPARWAVQA